MLILLPNAPSKQKDTDLLWDGIQTRMLYLFSEGVKKRGLSMKRFVELTSENAARFYHRYPQKGCLRRGGVMVYNAPCSPFSFSSVNSR